MIAAASSSKTFWFFWTDVLSSIAMDLAVVIVGVPGAVCSWGAFVTLCDKTTGEGCEDVVWFKHLDKSRYDNLFGDKNVQ